MDSPRKPVLGMPGGSPDAFAVASEDMRGGFPEGDVETWLCTEAAAAYDELRADPSQTVTGDLMRVGLAVRHAERGEDHRRA